VFTEQLVVWLLDRHFDLGVIQSSIHDWWSRKYASTLKTDVRYLPPDCFETFPRPAFDAAVEVAGRALDERRGSMMVHNDEGLTKTYNRLHNPDDDSLAISELRELHVALDLAVRNAYGWSDLGLGHGFHDTPQGRRFTLSPVSRTEVIDRLLELNHERYAEEVAAGLHAKQVVTMRQRPTVGEHLF